MFVLGTQLLLGVAPLCCWSVCGAVSCCCLCAVGGCYPLWCVVGLVCALLVDGGRWLAVGWWIVCVVTGGECRGVGLCWFVCCGLVLVCCLLWLVVGG